MRYLLVSYDDYFNIPYIRYYEEMLLRQNIDYDIVLWNRSGLPVSLPNAYVFSAKDCRSKVGKIIPFLRWRRFVLELISKKQYDRLIILTTMPAILLSDLLLKRYSGKFWLDIRDFTYENVPFYKNMVWKLVQSAASVSISSPAFSIFLPNSENILLTHNISNTGWATEHCQQDMRQRPLCIGFVGGIQFEMQNRYLLRQFANNQKYSFKYIGKVHPGCNLKRFCQENRIKNVQFLPAFSNDQKPEIYKSIDLINCVYGSDNQVSKLLLPNRLYDCVLFKKPIMVSKGTYLAEIVSKYSLGIAIDVERENVVEKLEEYLSNFSQQEFERGCRKFLSEIEKDMEKFAEALLRFCA